MVYPGSRKIMYSSGGVDTFICQSRSAGSIGCISDGGRSEGVACSRTIVEKTARKKLSVRIVVDFLL
jgi:hypothetical protein